MRANAGVILGIVVVSAVLGACSGAGRSAVSTDVVAHHLGVPPGVVLPVTGHRRTRPRVVRAPGRSIYVMTWGSGSCPRLPSAVTARGAHRVDITTAEHLGGGDACTADLAATTSLVRLPSGVDVAGVLVVRLDGAALHLPAK